MRVIRSGAAGSRERAGVYGYKLVLASEIGDEFTGEEWVDIPTPTGAHERVDVSFALRPVGANPVIGALRVALALSTDQPALLEMLDMRGRRLVARDVGALGAGGHDVDLGDTRSYAFGVYILRLSQLGRSVTSRVVLVRTP